MCQRLNTGESNNFYFGIFICIGPLNSAIPSRSSPRPQTWPRHPAVICTAPRTSIRTGGEGEGEGVHLIMPSPYSCAISFLSKAKLVRKRVGNNQHDCPPSVWGKESIIASTDIHCVGYGGLYTRRRRLNTRPGNGCRLL